jgi:hypothetical protein
MRRNIVDHRWFRKGFEHTPFPIAYTVKYLSIGLFFSLSLTRNVH